MMDASQPGGSRERREAANARLLAIITAYLRQSPDLRLGQALRNLGVVTEVRDARTGIPTHWENGFYEEPEAALARVEARAIELGLKVI